MKKKILAFVAVMIVAVIVFSFGARIARADEKETIGFSVNAKAFLLTDFDGTTEIGSSGKNERLPIASMVKIMTLDLIFEKIDEGVLSLDEDIHVSENASSMGGSQAFLDAGAVYKAEELIKSIIVASANDSCVAMAEHIAGSVEGFVDKMNDKARELGMKDTNFVNCTGLPAPDEYSSAADVALMSRDLMRHEKFFDYSGIWMFDFVHPGGRVTTLTNTNKLSRFYKGCDGGKTGFTSEALSCLSATAKRGDTRLLCVVIGAPSSKERNAEVTKLLNYGFANYESKKIFSFDDMNEFTLRLQKGKSEKLKLKAGREAFDFERKNRPEKEFTFNFVEERCEAPIKEGEKVGMMEIYKNGELYDSIEVFAAESVELRDFMYYLREIADKW